MPRRKRKRPTKPPVYFLARVSREWPATKARPYGFTWLMDSYSRCPFTGGLKQHVLENLETGDIIGNTLDLRAAAVYARKKETWPSRNKALRAIARWRKATGPRPKKTTDQKMRNLDKHEKNWTRKLKLAQTKLRKIRASKRRLQKHLV